MHRKIGKIDHLRSGMRPPRSPMNGRLAVELLFLASSVTTILLILRRPYLYIRLGRREVKVNSYFLGALVGPVLIMILGLLNYAQILAGLEGDGHLNPFGILILFLSMVFLSIFLDIAGFFEFCARWALRFAGNDGRRLFLAFYATVSFLTVFTSNDIVVLTFTPFIYYFTREAGINPKPYLIAEFFGANTWSMMLYIGNPTNILLASAFGLRFAQYLQWMALPTIAAGTGNLLMLYLLFRKEISRPITTRMNGKPSDAITDRTGAALGLLLLAGCVIALAIAPSLGLEMWIVSLSFALALTIILVARSSYVAVLRRNLKDAISPQVRSTVWRMPWPVVPFLISLFITVEALRIYGVTSEVGHILAGLVGSSAAGHVFVYGFSSALAANVLNNIPMTVAFAAILRSAPVDHLLGTVLATTVGSNLGANITPIGALAGIMWMSILRNKGVDLSFWDFVRYGLLTTPVTLLICLGILAIEFAI